MSRTAKERKGDCVWETRRDSERLVKQWCQVHARDSKSKMNLGTESNGDHIVPAAASVKHEGAVTAADQLFGGKHFLKY